jgi:hypothetical protein
VTFRASITVRCSSAIGTPVVFVQKVLPFSRWPAQMYDGTCFRPRVVAFSGEPQNGFRPGASEWAPQASRPESR